MAAPVDYLPKVILPPRDIGRIAVLVVMLFASSLAISLASDVIYFIAVPQEQWVAETVLTGLIGSSLVAAIECFVLVPVYIAVTGCRYPMTRFAWFLLRATFVAFGMYVVGGALGKAWLWIDRGSFAHWFPDVDLDQHPAGAAFVAVGSIGCQAGRVAIIAICTVGIIRGWRSLLRRARDAGPDGVLVR